MVRGQQTYWLTRISSGVRCEKLLAALYVYVRYELSTVLTSELSEIDTWRFRYGPWRSSGLWSLQDHRAAVTGFRKAFNFSQEREPHSTCTACLLGAQSFNAGRCDLKPSSAVSELREH